MLQLAGELLVNAGATVEEAVVVCRERARLSTENLSESN